MTLARDLTATRQVGHPLAHYRGEFPIFRDKIYLNTCSLGALGERTRRRIAEFLDLWQERGASAWYEDRKSTRLNSSHRCISYAVFCLKKKKENTTKCDQHTEMAI